MVHISIIIPTYKPREYLWECLDSIGNQIPGNYTYEILLVLNGPMEPYNSAIRNYMASHVDLHVRLLYSDVAGVSAARNLALEHVGHDDYVTFIDDDDYVSSSYLKGLADFAAPDRIVMARPVAFNDADGSIMPYRITDEYDMACVKGEMPAHSVRSIYCGTWMKLFPAWMVDGVRFDVRLRNSEDVLFVFELSKRFKKIICASPEAVYYRRVRADSAINIPRKVKVRNAQRVIRKCTMAFLSSPLSYNWIFYATRVLGLLKGIFAKDTY